MLTTDRMRQWHITEDENSEARRIGNVDLLAGTSRPPPQATVLPIAFAMMGTD
jgi:hypothetical protein